MAENTDTIKQVRDVTTKFVEMADKLTPFLEEGPFKVALLEGKTGIQTALAGLPSDGVGLTAQANAIIASVLSVTDKMQAILKSIVDGTTEAITRSRTALAGLPAQVTAGLDAAIKAQVAAGTLITKADHDTQISAATVQATTTAQAGFTAWQTDQTARKTELEPFKLGADRFKALMGATKDAYTAAVVLIKEVKAGPVAARSAISPLESHSEVTQPANTVLAFL